MIALRKAGRLANRTRVEASLSVQLKKGVAVRGAALMGVLNVTPDSFYDGGRYSEIEQARARVDRLLADGADILDIGGESTRPGSSPVSAEEQLARIEPALRYALARGALVSVDTTHPLVAERALSAGAQIVNDISCLADPDLARVCARHGATLLLMHSRGAMSSMPGFSVYPEDAYGEVALEVLTEWRTARDRAVSLGVPRENVWLDPGLGFAKSARHSFTLLRELRRFAGEGVPIVVGPSRKSFIELVDRAPPEARLGGTIAAALAALENGASVLRVHDVKDVHQALAVAKALHEPLPEARHV